MAFEFLDLENKLYQPTQALLDVMLNNIGNGYIWLKQALISAHSTVAKLGIEWYDEPIETSISWYEMGIQSSQNLYSRFINDLIPRAEAK